MTDTSKKVSDATFLSKIVEIGPSAVSIVSALTIAAATLYNWAYFDTVAPSSIQFLTLNDEISSVLTWLPITLSTFGLYMFVGLVVLYNKAKLSGNARPRPWVRYVYVVAPCLMVFCYLTEPVNCWFFALNAVMMLIVFIQMAGIRAGWSETVRMVILFILIFLSGSIFKGNADGLSSLGLTISSFFFHDAGFSSDAEGQPGEVTLVTSNGNQTSGLILVRAFEKGALFRVSGRNEVNFIPWTDIQSLEISTNAATIDIRLCSYFGWLCSPSDQ